MNFDQHPYELQAAYHFALDFAARRHQGHKMKKADLPYLVHVVEVTNEVIIASFHSRNFDPVFAMQVALLHDTLEDTDTEYPELVGYFGARVAQAVLALTKMSNQPEKEQLANSVKRIRDLSHEVWAVKLADRISNLQKPPSDWEEPKIRDYYHDSIMIYDQLGEGNAYLAQRLKTRIDEYRQFLQ